MALVLDTGVLYAVLDDAEPLHADCAGLVLGGHEQLVVPAPVLVELDYWLHKTTSIDVWVTFCEDVASGGYTIWNLQGSDALEAALLQARYSDQPIGYVDAAVFVTCMRLGEDKLATLDARHFRVLRTPDGDGLELLPTVS